VVLIDAALLIESPATRWVRPVIVVTAPEEERVKRLKERSGFGEKETLSRIRAQMPEEDRVAGADYVLDNSGTLEELEKKVRELWDKIVE
jgi:dephospho-CoA kinase